MTNKRYSRFTWRFLTVLLVMFSMTIGGVFAQNNLVEPSPTTAHFNDIDHVMIGVSDLISDGETFTRLGFALTNPTAFSPLGIGNRVIMFRPRKSGVGNFLELMQKINLDRLDPYMGSILAGPDGIKMVVNNTDEAEYSAEGMAQLGYIVSPVWSLWVEAPGRSLGNTVQFRVYAPRRDQMPLPVNGWNSVLNRSSPRGAEASTPRRLPEHPNGAVSWNMVTGVVSDDGFDEAVAAYEQIYGVSAIRPRDKVAEILLNNMTFRILGESAFNAVYPRRARAGVQPPPSYVSLRIEVADIAQTSDYLTSNDVTHIRRGSVLFVPPTHGGGVLFEFVPAE